MGNVRSARVADAETAVCPEAPQTSSSRRWLCCRSAADEAGPVISVSPATPRGPTRGVPGGLVGGTRPRSAAERIERLAPQLETRAASMSGHVSLSALMALHQGSHSSHALNTIAANANNGSKKGFPPRRTKSMKASGSNLASPLGGGLGLSGSPAIGTPRSHAYNTSRIVKARTASGDFALGAHKLAHLRSSVLGAALTASTAGDIGEGADTELLHFAAACELRAFAPGQMLYAQGAHPASHLFLLCAGELVVEVEGVGVPTPLFTPASMSAPSIFPPPLVLPTRELSPSRSRGVTDAATTLRLGGLYPTPSPTHSPDPSLFEPATPGIGEMVMPPASTTARPKKHVRQPSLSQPVSRRTSFNAGEGGEDPTLSSNNGRRSTFTFAAPVAQTMDSTTRRGPNGQLRPRGSFMSGNMTPTTNEVSPRAALQHKHAASTTFNVNQVLEGLRAMSPDPELEVAAAATAAASKSTVTDLQPSIPQAMLRRKRSHTLSVSLDTNQAAILAAHGLAPDGTRLPSSPPPTTAGWSASANTPTPYGGDRSGTSTPANNQPTLTSIRQPLTVTMPASLAQPTPSLRINSLLTPSPTSATAATAVALAAASGAPITTHSPSPISPPIVGVANIAVSTRPVFRRVALQYRGWLFGLEAVWALGLPPAAAPAPAGPATPSIVDSSPRRRTVDTPVKLLGESTPLSDAVAPVGIDTTPAASPTLFTAQSFPRLSNVVALTEGTCLTISQQNLESFFLRFPSSLAPLTACFGAHMASAVQSLPFLSHLSPAKLRLFLSLFSASVVPAATVLFEEGQASTDESLYYFIHHGTVRITLPTHMASKAGNGGGGLGGPAPRSPAHLGVSPTSPSSTVPASPSHGTMPPSPVAYTEKDLTAGTLFGELSLLLELERTATAVTSTSCTLLTISRRTLRNFLVLAPEVLVRFRENLPNYHLQNEYLLRIPVVQEFFLDFCAAEYSAENLAFVQAAARFKRLAEKSIEASVVSAMGGRKHTAGATAAIVLAPYLVRMATAIYDEFVCPAGARQVNLRAHVREAIHACVRPDIPTRTSPSLSGATSNTTKAAATATKTKPSSLTTSKSKTSPILGVGSLGAAKRGSTVLGPNLFEAAVREIYSLMSADSFARFRRSPLWAEALRKLNRAASVVDTAHWEEQLLADAEAERLAREAAGDEEPATPFGDVDPASVPPTDRTPSKVARSIISRGVPVSPAVDDPQAGEVDFPADDAEDDSEYVDLKELNLPPPASSDLAAYGELLAAHAHAANVAATAAATVAAPTDAATNDILPLADSPSPLPVFGTPAGSVGSASVGSSRRCSSTMSSGNPSSTSRNASPLTSPRSLATTGFPAPLHPMSPLARPDAGPRRDSASLAAGRSPYSRARTIVALERRQERAQVSITLQQRQINTERQMPLTPTEEPPEPPSASATDNSSVPPSPAAAPESTHMAGTDSSTDSTRARVIVLRRASSTPGRHIAAASVTSLGSVLSTSAAHEASTASISTTISTTITQ